MDGALLDDSEEKARQVNELLARRPLPSILVHAEAKPDWTWEGDPVTHVWVRLAHNKSPTAEERHELNEFLWGLKADIRALPTWQFVHYKFLPAQHG